MISSGKPKLACVPLTRFSFVIMHYNEGKVDESVD